VAESEPFRADPDGDGVAEKIKWGRLVSTAVGIVLGTVGIKLADLVGALIAIPIGLYQAVIGILEGLIGAVLGLPARMIQASVDEAVAFVSEFGVGGFVVAIALVVVTAWLAANARGVAG
jgi:hypothetical protein